MTETPVDQIAPEHTHEDRRAAFLETQTTDGDLSVRTFEFNSRGARVVGRLYGDGAAAERRVLIAHDAGQSSADPQISGLCRELATRGAWVAVLDLPLHGARSNPKLTPRLLASLGAGYLRDELEEALWRDYSDQTRADFSGCLEVLEEALPTPAPTCFLGLGLGASCGAHFLSRDAGVDKSVLVGLRRHAVPDALVPVTLPPSAGPVLLLSGGEDVPRGETEALAAEIPAAESEWFPGSGSPPDLPQRAWQFFAG